jgi:cytosine/adenosine deaminase-related metal-dependent hydrolase
VLCPSSNLFIEGKLPDLPMLIELGAKLTIGTDSFASSNTLSVYDQLMILLNHFPSLTFTDILNWGTLNGAKALGVDSKFGSFEIGKLPGLNLITDFDFRLMMPTAKSRVRPLV